MLDKADAELKRMEGVVSGLRKLVATSDSTASDVVLCRADFKESFIVAKRSARAALLAMLPSERAPREARLLAVQAAYRAEDMKLKAFKASHKLSATASGPARGGGSGAAGYRALLYGASGSSHSSPAEGTTNAELLNAALALELSNTNALRDGAAILVATREDAISIASTLASNHEKVRRPVPGALCGGGSLLLRHCQWHDMMNCEAE